MALGWPAGASDAVDVAVAVGAGVGTGAATAGAADTQPVSVSALMPSLLVSGAVVVGVAAPGGGTGAASPAPACGGPVECTGVATREPRAVVAGAGDGTASGALWRSMKVKMVVGVPVWCWQHWWVCGREKGVKG